jgi:light-independent protochlorophyllide reductase subunit B
MQLTVWTYEGPPHVGAMRVATALRKTHLVLHAPQGDTYADLLFTMIERSQERPSVSYTTFQARDLGADTAELLQAAAHAAYQRFQPELLLIGASCTAELLQDDPAGIGAALGLPIPVVPLELYAYQHKENRGAAETFYKVVRACNPEKRERSGPRSCNILGPSALGFRHRDDLQELRGMLVRLGIPVNVIAPLGAAPKDLARLGDAAFNIVLYPEIAGVAARWLSQRFEQPNVEVTPIGVRATREFVCKVAELAGVDPAPLLDREETRMPWYARSVDSNYLTGKRVFIFGDATHAIAAARVAREELGFEVVGLGTYSREYAREVRAAAERMGLTALITDDHMEVEAEIAKLQPELLLGTQMERHIAKRFGIPCAVISAPVHVQDYPARYAPVVGYQGADVIFDTWVHPLMMGLEEHLLSMFREDFEFRNDAPPSHLGSAQGAQAAQAQPSGWTPEAEQELKKIPFFVRAKARRNTEAFAGERGLARITLEVLYDAKAHYGR